MGGTLAMSSVVVFRVLSVVALAWQPQLPATTVDLRCGGYCLFVALRALDQTTMTYAEFERKLGPPGPAGYSMGQLAEVARSLGAHAMGVQTTLDNLRARQGQFACIALVDRSHFLMIADIKEDYLEVIDPPQHYGVPQTTFEQLWKGDALLISPDPLVEEGALAPRATWPWPAAGASLIVVALLTLLAHWVSRRASGRNAHD